MVIAVVEDPDDIKVVTDPDRMGPARFWEMDLHVHTPGSTDVSPHSYGASTPEEIVDAAISAGLDAIAITDHNTTHWCSSVVSAAESAPLVVLPGVEISTSEGHLLGLWEEGTDTQELSDVLVKLGINTRDHGKLDISASVGFLEAARAIDRSGGVAIAAHGDRPKGLLQLPVVARIREILESGSLSAVEVVDLATVESVRARMRGSVQIACTRSSDTTMHGSGTHILKGIGRRRTWVKASRPDLCGLKHALADPSLRIRLEQPSAPRYPRIVSISVAGGFLKGEHIDFSSDLSCMLGGTGTGKSLAIELIRFVLNQQASADSFPAVRSEVDSKLLHALGTDSTVKITIADADGDTSVIARTYDEHSVTSPELILGSAVSIPIRAFSQGEIIEYARAPVGRMQLVDSGIDLSDLSARLEEAESELAHSSVRVSQLRSDVIDAERILEGLPQVSARLDELSALFDAEVVKSQEAWASERSRFEGIVGLIEKRFKVATSATFDYQPANEENKDLHDRVCEALDAFRATIGAANESIAKAREECVDALRSVSQEWSRRYEAYDKQLLVELEKVGGGDKDLRSLRVRLRQLQEQKSSIEGTGGQLENSLRPALDAARAEREAYVDDLMALRRERLTQRRSRVRLLNVSMGGAVKINIMEQIDDSDFLAELTSLARGSRLRSVQLKAISEKALPVKLVRSYMDGDAQSVADATGVPVDRIEALFAHVEERGLERDFVALETFDIGDGLAVKFKRPENGQYEDIERLAHGQKCTAILVIALAEGDEPLVIDQPEDALHAPWIEEFLVDRLRQLRGQRQYIFASRSPGLVVSADAELLVTLTSTADRGRVEAAGSLERYELNRLALYHLEGGPVPFRRRAGKLSESM